VTLNFGGVAKSWSGQGCRRFNRGSTDEFGFQAVEGQVHVHDLHATLMRLIGFDHERFTYRYAGLDYRLTGVNDCSVVKELLG
jgi:hypothetical protein